MANNYSFRELASFFALNSHVHARMIFYRHLSHYFQFNLNIPAVKHLTGAANQGEIDKLLQYAYSDMCPFYRALVRDFEDPSGRNRVGVILNIDATYLDTTSTADLQLQKYVYYQPRAGHTIKLTTQ